MSLFSNMGVGQILLGIGFKRTTGAPTTYADLTTDYHDLLTNWDSGTFKQVGADTQVSAKIGILTSTLSDALAGDHVWLFATLSADGSIASYTTFDALLSAGTLGA